MDDYLYNTGIALSGGAVRSIAHLGVLKALNEVGVYPDAISGVSAGALVGVFYADGHKPEDVLEIIKDQKIFDFLNLRFPRRGFFKLDRLYKLLDANLHCHHLEALNTPFYISATNLNTGNLVIFDKGYLPLMVMASCSIPILFQAVNIDDDLYVDGGLMSNLPVEPLEGKCRNLIGVNVNPIGEADKLNNLYSILHRTILLCTWSNVSRNIEKCDFYIEPEGLRQYGLFDSSKINEIFMLGYDFTMRYIHQHEKTLIQANVIS